MNIVDDGTGEVTQSIDLAALKRPFSSAAVEQRDGGGGRKFNYIAVETCIRRLNEAVQNWSFRMVPGTIEWLDGGTDRNNNQSKVLMVVGELTIPGLGARQGIGIQRVIVPVVNGEDMIKGALGDALKKAATLFGVALELYGPDLDAMGGPREGQRMAPEQRQQVDAQHERNTGASNLHQHAQLRSLAEHGFDLAPRLAALGVATIEELSREQALELIVTGRQSVRGVENAPPASPPRSTLPATRNHPQQPDGQDRARQNIAEKMAARGLPVLPMDTYAEIAETVNNALKAARCEARVQPGGRDGEVRPGDILNALMALPSAVPTNG